MYTGRASGSPPQLCYLKKELLNKKATPFPDLVFVLKALSSVSLGVTRLSLRTVWLVGWRNPVKALRSCGKKGDPFSRSGICFERHLLPLRTSRCVQSADFAMDQYRSSHDRSNRQRTNQNQHHSNGLSHWTLTAYHFYKLKNIWRDFCKKRCKK
jgi:hypothetical protein